MNTPKDIVLKRHPKALATRDSKWSVAIFEGKLLLGVGRDEESAWKHALTILSKGQLKS